MLLYRFTDKIYTQIETVKGSTVFNMFSRNKLVSALIAKQVGVLGQFSKSELKKSILGLDKNELSMINDLVKNGVLYLATDNQLKVFKSKCKSPEVKKAFTERYFATFDYSLIRSPNSTKARDWFVRIAEVDDE